MNLIIGFLFVSILGTFFHFTYKLFNKNKISSIFSAVNESTWEHIKMALSASFLLGIFEGINLPINYFFAKSISIIIVILLIPILFYGYKMFTKKSYLVIDILIFYIAVFVSQYLYYYIINNIKEIFVLNYLGCIILFIIFAFYLLLTIYPLKNELFLDPITKKYGVNK